MSDQFITEAAANISIEKLPEYMQGIAEVFGIEHVLRLCEKFGGMRLYVPKIDFVLRDFRDNQICKEFNGSNHRELAKKYNKSESWIREILKRTV